MPFPTIAAKGTTYNSAGVALEEHVIDLPDNLTVGQRLVVIVSRRSTTVNTWPAGWTQVVVGNTTLNNGRLEVHSG
jgi:hypothetical protein